MRGFDRDLIRGGHYGQRPGVPRSKAEHMAAPTNAAGVKKALANPEPSTHVALLARRPTKVAAIALANKLARMAWAMMARGERYNYPASLRV